MARSKGLTLLTVILLVVTYGLRNLFYSSLESQRVVREGVCLLRSSSRDLFAEGRRKRLNLISES